VAIADWPGDFQPSQTAASANAPGDNRLVAIANGRFDEAKIKTYALKNGKSVQHGKLTLYEVPGDAPGDPPVSLEFLSPNRIALASGANAEDLLALPTSTARDPAMQSLIDRVAGAPIFAVARTNSLPTAFYENLASSPQLQQLVRSVNDLSIAGAPEAQQVQLILDAECDSVKDALEMTTDLEGFRMFGSLALTDPKTRRRMTPGQIELLLTVVHQIKITRDDRSVRLTLEVTPAMIRLATAPPPPAHAR
jgi:hypothetical protein